MKNQVFLTNATKHARSLSGGVERSPCAHTCVCLYLQACKEGDIIVFYLEEINTAGIMKSIIFLLQGETARRKVGQRKKEPIKK